MLTVEQARAIARERSIPEPNTGCWLWLGATNDQGYPHVARRIGGSQLTVFMSRALLGLSDPSIDACHTCDTPLCVNEDHLFVGDARANLRDCVDKGRSRPWKRGVTHCAQGHEFTPANTRYYDQGGTQHRACRECRRRWAANRRARLRHRVASSSRAAK